MINWVWKSFDELSAAELYEILKLRQDVFCIEQDCLYPDIDGADGSFIHLMGWNEQANGTKQLAAYLRVVAPGIKQKDASLGRVVTSQTHRRDGIGREMMKVALEHMDTQLNYPTIKISAQQYLEKFYSSFGFVTVSDPYDEDGIPHIAMRRHNPHID